MFSNLITKSDVVRITNLSTNPLSLTSPELTQKLMNGVTTVTGLIKAIEKYSDDNNLPLGKRVPYAVVLNGNMSINVAKSYFINSDNVLVIVGWNTNGFVRTNYRDDGSKDMLNDVSTYVVPIANVTAVNFGSYDPSKVTIFSDESMKNVETELVRKLTMLLNDLNSLKSAGMHRSLIIKYNSVMMSDNLNLVATYTYNPSAYKMYLQLADIYESEVKEVVNYYQDKALSNPKQYNKYHFYKDDYTLRSAIKAYEARTDVERFRESITMENSFTYTEIEELGKVLGLTLEVPEN